MAPVFGLFASASSPAIERVEETGSGMAASANAKTKGRRGGKPPPTKKQPQRGLGVEKLEQLRLQERWKMMHGAMDRHSPPRSTISCHDSFLPTADISGSNDSLPPADGVSPVDRRRRRENAGLSIVRPAMRKQQPVPEPPSSQIPPPCFSPRCEFCVRKKRLFEENPAMQHGCDYKETDLTGSMNAHMRNSATEVELKEYDFFPRNPDAGFQGESEVDGANFTTAARCPSSSIDLTLRLSR
ncbi:hypothetical protein HPP92_015977 [Vanilla planifolia]|uniref:Uncharacterized protein n=1 Tax=Vanilla planifolia TaxID=51239 RepID=A0A835QPP9_VANPL|nr:hypothetical protein HPP92_015977 [Vanilla planifolia]